MSGGSGLQEGAEIVPPPAVAPTADLPDHGRAMGRGDAYGSDGWGHGLGEGEDAQARRAGEPVPQVDHGICYH